MGKPKHTRDVIPSELVVVEPSRSVAVRAPSIATPEDVAELRELVEGARPLNTRLAYEGDIAHFKAWCADRGAVHFPATSEVVMVYLKDLAYGRGPRATHGGRVPRGSDGRWSWATIQRHRGSIAKMHKIAHAPDPTSSERVRELMLSIRRRLGKAQRQAKPLLPEHLRAAFAAMPTPRAVVDVRDAAVATLTFALAGRRSEVSALDVADVEFAAAGILVNIGPSAAQPERRTKTNQEGEREVLTVPAGADPTTDPTAILRAWLAVRGDESGPLFYGITRQGRIRRKRMPAQRISIIAKRLAQLAGLNPKDYSGHSFRAGFVTAADAAGAPHVAIMRQTRHKLADTLKRYVRPEDGFRNHPGKGLL